MSKVKMLALADFAKKPKEDIKTKQKVAKNKEILEIILLFLLSLDITLLKFLIFIIL